MLLLLLVALGWHGAKAQQGSFAKVVVVVVVVVSSPSTTSCRCSYIGSFCLHSQDPDGATSTCSKTSLKTKAQVLFCKRFWQGISSRFQKEMYAKCFFVNLCALHKQTENPSFVGKGYKSEQLEIPAAAFPHHEAAAEEAEEKKTSLELGIPRVFRDLQEFVREMLFLTC